MSGQLNPATHAAQRGFTFLTNSWWTECSKGDVGWCHPARLVWRKQSKARAQGLDAIRSLPCRLLRLGGFVDDLKTAIDIRRICATDLQKTKDFRDLQFWNAGKTQQHC